MNMSKHFSTKKKRLSKGCFDPEWSDEFPFIIKSRKHNVTAYCNNCRSEINVAQTGKNAITRHIETDKHKTCTLSVGTTSYYIYIYILLFCMCSA